MNNSAHWDEVYKNGRDFKVLNLVFLDELLKRLASGGTADKTYARLFKLQTKGYE